MISLQYFISILIVLNINVEAITNLKHAVGCEHEKIKLSCNKGFIINILDANYGRTNSATCTKDSTKDNVGCVQETTLSTLTDLCEGHTECELDIENKVFGDPCPGTFKYLFVLYQCVFMTEFKHSLACEHKPVILECSPGSVIHVYSANYGRRSQLTCSDGPIQTTNCQTEHSVNVVSQLCNQKRSCSVAASNNVFGDPCVGTYKYLTVKYKCIPGSDDCLAPSTETQCLNGSIISPSLICDGKQDCPHGDDEHLCSYVSKFACEHNKLEIKCRKDEVIKILSANYGRTSAKLCPQSDIRTDLNCRSGNSRQIVEASCEGKHKCEIYASNNIFGDPCSGIVKYLDVQYECLSAVGHKIIPRSINN